MDGNWKMVKPEKKNRPKVRYYLAYGSNLNMYQMLVRCPGARRRGWGKIPDYELLYKGSKTGSYLTIEPREGAYVPVGVFTVTPEDEKKLDRYEGFPRFYYKKEMKIRVWDQVLEKHRMVDAFVYIMHEDRPFGVPSDYYVDVCREGYAAFGFDQGKLTEALRISAREAQR